MEYYSESELDTYSHLLTPADRDLIMQQCEHQHATRPEQIAGFTKAYALAKHIATETDLSMLTPHDVLQLDHKLATFIEPSNGTGYRSVTASFANGKHALDPQLILHSMQNWAKHYVERSMSPQQSFTEYEGIHPYKDGNGRAGDLWWKIDTYRVTGQWPTTLPPDVFGPNAQKEPHSSAFGEIE